MSWKTVRRTLKTLGASYRRARRVPAKVHDERREASFVKALEKARLLCEQGAIDILHGDESGFCLSPCVPYLWQFKGQTVGLAAKSHNQRFGRPLGGCWDSGEKPVSRKRTWFIVWCWERSKAVISSLP